MKKVAMVVAMFLIATMSLGGMTAFAAEAPEGSGQYVRPAFLENMESPKVGIAFGMMRNGEGREWAELTDEAKDAILEGIKASLAEKLDAGEITQEEYDKAIAKIESGNFTFGGKGFKGMGGKKPENMGSFKPEVPVFDGRSFKDMGGKWAENMGNFKSAMPAFDGENFKNLGGKPGERLELADEQKAALMENIKSSLGDDFPAGKLMPIKNAVPGMPGRAIKPAVTAEQ